MSRRPQPTLALTSMSQFTPQPLRWLWDQRLAIGKLAIVAGDPGLGKSFLTLDLAARVSRDGVMPDGWQGPCGDVVLISAEDDPADTLQPRLIAAGANLDRIHFVRGVTLDAPETVTSGSSSYIGGASTVRTRTIEPPPPSAFTLGNVAALRRVMETMRPVLIVIDPISAYLGETDSNNNAQVRALLAPLSALAGEFGCCILAVSHLNKSNEANGKAMYRTMGSLAFVAAARSAWLVTRHKGHANRRIFAQIKNNLGRERKAISFEMTQSDAHDQATVTWDPTEIDVSADDAMEDRVSLPGRPDDARQRAAGFLKDRLRTQGSATRADLLAEALVAGISKTTLDRAADDLKLLKTPNIDGENGVLWKLVPDIDPTRQAAD